MDRVNCARCGMLVSSDANAAQSHVPGEATRFFDDIGCLASDVQSRTGAVRYVRLAAGGWTLTESGWFAVSDGARTPMDYGILAFTSRDDAAAADRDKRARDWVEIIKYAEAR